MSELDPSISLEDHIINASIDIGTVRRSSNKHIYIINTSDFEGTELRGEVSLKFQSESGNERYKVPDTWIPLDITQWQEKEKWTRDTGFNKLVSSGYLTIVDPEIAEQVLDSDEAKEELKRLRKTASKLSAKESEVRMNTNAAASKAREKFKAVNDVKKASIQASTENSSVSPRVMAIMKNTNTDEVQKLAALKSARSSITEGDIGYIMMNCGKDHPKIKAWAIEAKNKG